MFDVIKEKISNWLFGKSDDNQKIDTYGLDYNGKYGRFQISDRYNEFNKALLKDKEDAERHVE